MCPLLSSPFYNGCFQSDLDKRFCTVLKNKKMISFTLIANKNEQNMFDLLEKIGFKKRLYFWWLENKGISSGRISSMSIIIINQNYILYSDWDDAY